MNQSTKTFRDKNYIMDEVNSEYYGLFPYSSKEYEHVCNEIPWDIVNEIVTNGTKITILKLGEVIATVIDDGNTITVKDSRKWKFYLDFVGRDEGTFGFKVFPQGNTFDTCSSEYGYTLCQQTFDLDLSLDEAAEMYIVIDHTKYPTPESLIEYLESKGLIYDSDAEESWNKS